MIVSIKNHTDLRAEFNSVSTSALVFAGVSVAWAGGFIMLWLYAQPWFLDFSLPFSWAMCCSTRYPGTPKRTLSKKPATIFTQKIDSGELNLPAGVSYAFTGTYENQVRSQKRLTVILPLALIIIFIILYLQFNSVSTSALVFAGVSVAWAGGFIMLWLYAQPWFLDFSLFGVSMRALFQVHPINLSVAVWVGFLALFGIATDDGVVMATYLKTTFSERRIETAADVREATLAASQRRVRPCLMTTATTVLALIPVLTSTGRGSDIMVPMAIPTFGGMTLEVITMLVVPVAYCWIKESQLRRGRA